MLCPRVLNVGCYNGQKVVRGEIESGGGSGCGNELVALDFCSDADVAVGIRLDANNLSATTDIDFGALRDLLGKREDKLDFSADFELRFGEEIESLIADVACLGAEFAGARFAWKHP
jgi:hypothetical protein